VAKLEIVLQVEPDVIQDKDTGRMVDGIRVTCPNCDHVVECFGRTDRSEKRACMVMREECPEGDGDAHWYTTEELKAQQEEQRRNQGGGGRRYHPGESPW